MVSGAGWWDGWSGVRLRPLEAVMRPVVDGPFDRPAGSASFARLQSRVRARAGGESAQAAARNNARLAAFLFL